MGASVEDGCDCGQKVLSMRSEDGCSRGKGDRVIPGQSAKQARPHMLLRLTRYVIPD
jgi:hypothetical protein